MAHGPMKLALGVLALGVGVGFVARQWIAVRGGRHPSGPSVEFLASRAFDWGAVAEGELVEHAFIIGNAGREPLLVGRVLSGCGCTSARATKGIVRAGEHSEIVVGYRGRPTADREVVSVFVETNDPANPVVRFVVTGLVRVAVSHTPRAVSRVCACNGPPASTVVRFGAGNGEGFELEGEPALSVGKYVSVSWERPSAAEGLLTVRITDCPRGTAFDMVRVPLMSAGGRRDVRIPVYVIGEEAVAAPEPGRGEADTSPDADGPGG